MAMMSWPLADRPRERLAAVGAQALSDSELLAVVLGTGIPGRNAVELSRELLERHGSLRSLLAPLPETSGGDRIDRGLGAARRARLVAAVELARRAAHEDLVRAPNAFSAPALVRDYLRTHFMGYERESFVVLLLDSQHRLLAIRELFRGTLTQTSVYPREVVKAALGANSAAVIFAHNHPSGVAEPSRADELLTRSLAGALATVDIRALDHFIVAGPTVISLAERGLF